MKVSASQITPLLKKKPICSDQKKIDDLVEWIASNRTGKDKSYLISEIQDHNLDCCDSIYLKNPLHMAIIKQDIPLTRKFLENNCNPQAKNPEGKDAYYFAVQTGNITIFQLVDRFQKIHSSSCWFCTIL